MPLLPLLPLVTSVTPLSPLLHLDTPVTPITPCYPCHPLLPLLPLLLLVTPVTPCYLCYPLLPLLPLITLVTPCYLCSPCYPLLPLVTIVTPYYPLLPFVTPCYPIRMILTMNNFSFNDKHYLQTHGTAMGTRMAPSYANLFLAKFETGALSRAPFQPFIWWRYIDDVFMIWTRSVQDLNTFTSFLNYIHPTIKFTCDHSFTSIPFLDVNVSLRNGKIVTDLYKHQYLLHSSCHPIHTKRAIPFSLALRLRRICSTNETFTLRTNELIGYLQKRGYNRYFLQREIQRVNNITQTEALTPPDTSTLDKPERVPFVITYNPALRSISSIIRKHFHILISSPRCYNVFKAAPIVACRRSSNLSDFLVRAQLRNLTQHNQPRGSYPCGKNCLTCKYISDGQTSYTFHATGETRPITNHIDCNSKNVIYMIQCNQCSKQYIGETKRRLKDRFNVRTPQTS